MTRNIKRNKENNRSLIRRQLVLGAGSLGAMLLSVPYYVSSENHPLWSSIKNITSQQSLNWILGGFILGALGGLLGSFLGLVCAIVVVPVAYKKPTASENEHVAGRVRKP